ncbi:IS1595 family transposase [Phenylobacterium sp.]|uniref:IS1595 family transposase n=1 Tax=Phenylobacterium sp. TaxID=1871053 RepID=UPI0027349E64|nr:IS1595 family transposase [Phenylobacterium sp.]MDP3853126.1 IS1595 family transposase [Phenylobacterium sp.]
MSVLSKPYFHNEAEAFAFVESVLWAQGPVCPHCGAMGRVYVLAGVRTKATKKNPEGVVREGLKKCGDCRKQFTVRIGTIFEESHLPLHKWLQAIFLMCSSKKGVSSHQLHRTLEVTYKTAWFLSHRIREAMRDGELAPFGGGGGIVEVDETFQGQDPDAAPSKMAIRNKNAILTLVERGGRARSIVMPVDQLNAANIAEVLSVNVVKEARLRTDEAKHYITPGKAYAEHQSVAHAREEYVSKDDPTVHTNTVEGFYSIFKRGMKGVYQHCSKKHLHRYAAEFDFRYSNRIALGVDDKARAVTALKGVVGKRLTYRRPHDGLNARG